MIRKRRNKNLIIRSLMLMILCAGFLGIHADASMQERMDRIRLKQETGMEAESLPGFGFLPEAGVKEPETESTSESEAQTESMPEAQTESATEAESLSEREMESTAEQEPETESPSETERGEVLDIALTIPEELEKTLAQLTGIEEETETEEEPETETETEAETEVDAQTSAKMAMLQEIQLGAGFQIPMTMPLELGTIPENRFYHCGRLPFGQEDIENWQRNQTIDGLEEAVENAVSGYDGVWSVYVKNLNTDESFLINDTPMKSASVMKLFIMGTVYTAMENGRLERTDQIMSLLNRMITYSDNEASNELLAILGDGSYMDGIARVNTFIREYGYSDMTVEYNGFSNPATNSGEGTNQVSAADVGKLLEDIYRRTWLTRADSNEVEAMMLAQDTRRKIPAGLPDGVLCANKTGEMNGTENDAAIIYSDGCDYILVILSSDWSDSSQAVTRIRNLSALVYEYFN